MLIPTMSMDLKVYTLKGNFKDTKHINLAKLRSMMKYENSKFGLNKDIFSLAYMMLKAWMLGTFSKCTPPLFSPSF